MQSDDRRRAELETAAGVYFAMAAQMLRPHPPCVVAIGGLSGTGKSTLARTLAPSVGRVPGALVVRSDEVRKRLCNVAPLARLEAEAYSPAVTARVYQAVGAMAGRAIRAGHSVIVDAVYSDAAERERIEQVARTASVPFVGIWLEAPGDTLVARVTSRRRDASDADADVVRLQLSRDCGEVTWQRIDANLTTDAVAERARAVVGGKLRAGGMIPHTDAP
jgi:predicted kinase